MNKYLEFAHYHGDLPEDLCLLVDVSGSMLERDYPPSRLEAARKAAAALLQQKAKLHPCDRVGIASFGGYSKTEHPLIEVGRGLRQLKRVLEGLEAGSSTNITAGLLEAAVILGCRGAP